MKFFNHLESNVRGYIRSFPEVFSTARGARICSEEGKEYIDFFSGAGTLNYGHNHPEIKRRLIEYLETDGVVHGLDMATSAKKDFLGLFESKILKPRGMNYKIQFTGPTGTNAVEAALKIARLVKKRSNIISFTNGFHGVTMGSVAATGNSLYRKGVGVPLHNITFMPYANYLGPEQDTLNYLKKLLSNAGSGVDHPAAVILETVQGEGGVNVASVEWLRGLQDICRQFDMLLIVDDIQVGCGRTGSFFSFEKMGLDPDLILLSKSIGAYGLPMSLVLLKPELDTWEPGQHNGKFRGNNLAFVAASEAIRLFWSDERFVEELADKARLFYERAENIRDHYEEGVIRVKGRGLILGLEFKDPSAAKRVSRTAFMNGLLVETCGPSGQVVKILPPLVIEPELILSGMQILHQSIADVLGSVSRNGRHGTVALAKGDSQ